MPARAPTPVDPLDIIPVLPRSSGEVIGSVGQSPEESLRASARLLEAIVDQSPLPMVVGDLEGRLKLWNRAAERMFGWKESEVLGRISPLIPPGRLAEFKAALKETVERGVSSTIETERVTRDGRHVWIRLTMGLIRDDSGAVTATLGIAEDITAQREAAAAEREREAKQQLTGRIEAIGRLAGGIAHDFNNVLTALRGTAEILRGSLPEGSEWAEDANEIVAAADRAASLTRQLLAFSRQQVLQPQRLDLARVAGGVTRMLERLIGPRIEFAHILPTGCAFCHADAGQIEQVIVNLAVNARDAMPSGGDLTLAVLPVAVVAADPHRPRMLPPGDFVELSISDTGGGMDESTRSRIFEPFFTTKELGRGTGLGLSTVYGIVKQSGGFIFAESVIGHGATFRVFLPAVAEGPVEEAAHATATAPTPRSPAGEKLLIVDDEAPIRMLLSRAFTALGYVTSVAATTHDALQLIDREGLPALVISDLWMPGSSGVDFLHHLRQRAPTLPLVLFSGDGEALAAADAEQWQHVALLQKPLRLDALAVVVAGLLQTADGRE